MVIQPVARATYPAPTGFKTVVAGFGADQVRYTVARHQITGTNRFGQTSTKFPFCLVNPRGMATKPMRPAAGAVACQRTGSHRKVRATSSGTRFRAVRLHRLI
jgi:hypothetical protein